MHSIINSAWRSKSDQKTPGLSSKGINKGVMQTISVFNKYTNKPLNHYSNNALILSTKQLTKG
jgi:hypothetical protein